MAPPAPLPVSLSPPAAPGDFPDPWVLVEGGRYLAFATNGRGANVQVRESSDLTGWEDRPDALPALPAWAAPGFTWSPAVAAAGPGRWALWYAVRHAASGRQAISVAEGSDPAGPYQDRSGAPAIFQVDEGGSIDPSVFTDTDGSRYLLWKVDANAIMQISSLWAAPLDPGGTTLAGPAAQLVEFDRPWEATLVEAPSMLHTSTGYLLFYSAGRWDTDGYAIGLARADHPLGPWTKLTVDRPWAASDPAAAGPGGQEAFAAVDGTPMLAYHAWDPGRIGYPAGGARSLRVGRLEVDGDRVGLQPLP